MKMKEAIDRADRLRPNAVHPDDKKHALWELESQFAEMIGEDVPDWNDKDYDGELLIASPYDIVYVLSLMAFIDFAQEEMDLYQIDAMMANQKQAEVKALYRRHHEGPDIQIKGVFL